MGMNAGIGLDARNELHANGRKTMLVGMENIYHCECRDKHGRLKWKETIYNLVPEPGLNALLDAMFVTGRTSPAWYVGLKGAGTVQAADTLASHAGWSEITPYSGNRPAWTPGSISNGQVDNSASKASFLFTSDTTIYGIMLCDAASGTTGVLYGAGDFSEGARDVLTDDTLAITAIVSAVAL